LEPLLAEGASLDLVASNASLNQGVTNGVDIGFTNLNFLIILFLLLKFFAKLIYSATVVPHLGARQR